MLRKNGYIIILMLVLVSCSSNSAFKFSENITAKEKEIEPEQTILENSVERYIENEQYDSLAIGAKKMEDKVQKIIDDIKAMKTPAAKEAENFKAASIRYFEFLKKIYTSYYRIGKAETEEERSEEATAFMELYENRQKAVDEIQEAQRKFARANNFKIRN